MMINQIPIIMVFFYHKLIIQNNIHKIEISIQMNFRYPSDKNRFKKKTLIYVG